jgi:hypothetical protein
MPLCDNFSGRGLHDSQMRLPSDEKVVIARSRTMRKALSVVMPMVTGARMLEANTTDKFVTGLRCNIPL